MARRMSENHLAIASQAHSLTFEERVNVTIVPYNPFQICPKPIIWPFV